MGALEGRPEPEPVNKIQRIAEEAMNMLAAGGAEDIIIMANCPSFPMDDGRQLITIHGNAPECLNRNFGRLIKFLHTGK